METINDTPTQIANNPDLNVLYVQNQKANQNLQPQNVIYYKYAGFWIRLVAYFIDGLILFLFTLPLMIIYFLVFAVNFLNESSNSTSSIIEIFGFQIFFGITSLLITFIYQTFFLVKYGATPGKKALGIKVIKTDYSKITIGTVILREFIGKWISGIFFNLGFIWAGFDKCKQAWQDKIANTYVVYNEQISKEEYDIQLTKKTNKVGIALVIIFFLLLFLIGVAGIIASAILVAIDPVSKFNEATAKACKTECSTKGDNSNKCVLACMQNDKIIEKGDRCSLECENASDVGMCVTQCVKNQTNSQNLYNMPLNNVNWIKFDSPVQSYSIDFPGQPGTKTSEIEFEDTQSKAIETSHGINTVNGSFIATSLELPVSYNEEDKKYILDSMPQLMANREGSEVLYSKNIEVGNNKAIEFEIKLKKGYVKYVSFIIDNNMYTLGVGSPSQEYIDFDKFLSSFQYNQNN